MKVDEKSVQADSEKDSEIVTPFNAEWRDRVLTQLRNDAATRAENMRTEKSVVEERLLVVEAQIKALAKERDDLETRLVIANAGLKNSLGD